MKAIILAGGSGSRLYPLTYGVSKQLLPVWDKPMIYYPLSVLMLAGIRDILVITTEVHLPLFEKVLKNGSQWGLNFQFAVQKKPQGIAQAFLIGKDFIGSDDVCLILGDNIFYGHALPQLIENAKFRLKNHREAVIFGYNVSDPQRYGVAGFDSSGKVISIEEKPKVPASNYAIVGLYFYPSSVVDIAQGLTPSQRGELEITDINKAFLSKNKLHIELMGRGYTWLDAGTHESLLQASQFVETLEKRTGLKIACPEEIAFKKGFITKQSLIEQIELYKGNPYGEYLSQLINHI